MFRIPVALCLVLSLAVSVTTAEENKEAKPAPKAETKKVEPAAKEAAAKPGAKTEVAGTKAESGAKTDKTVAKKETPASEASGDAKQELSIERAAICTGIENREPKGEAEKFAAGTTKLYCFSHIKGAKDDTQIRHTWFHNDQSAGGVSLDVRSSSWRTYSSKTVGEGRTGKWKVEIADATTGKVLETLSFVVE